MTNSGATSWSLLNYTRRTRDHERMACNSAKDGITERIKAQGEIVRSLKAEGAAAEKVCTEPSNLRLYIRKRNTGTIC